MSDNKLNQEQLYALLQYASRRLNITPAQLAEALAGGQIGDLASRLPPDSAAKLQGMMGDRARAEQLLQSPQAQALIRKVLGKD